MDKEIFESLLQYSEGRIIDYKRTMYDFSNDPQKENLFAFLKDIISFSNTIRNEASYIIIGVKDEKGNKDFCGMPNSVDMDEAELQAKAKSKIFPHPYFNYHIVHHDEKRFGVFEFPIHKYDTLLSSRFDFKSKVKAGEPYHRVGSMNEPVSIQQGIQIHEWFKSLTHPSDSATISSCIKDLLYDSTDEGNKLTDIMIDALDLAKKYKFKELEKFCSDELTGNISDKDYRYVNTMFSIGTIQHNGINVTKQMITEHLRKEVNLFHYDVYLGHSINQLEISHDRSVKNNSYAQHYSKIKAIKPDFNGEDYDITFYLFADTFEKILSSIRQELIKKLTQCRN